MKRIIQEHGTGCGIACVAMIAGSTYAEVMNVARQLFGWPASQRSFYTSSGQLRQLLEVFRVPSQQGRAVRNWSSLPDAAVVGINHNKNYDTWHWVVFCRAEEGEFVLDPRSKRDKRTDFGRMSLRSYIPVMPRVAGSTRRSRKTEMAEA